MKTPRLLLAAAAVLISFTAARAETAASYVGEITGLVCASCKMEVVDALSKMDGVKNVEIVASNQPDIRKITIATTRDSLTSADVNQTLEKVSKDFKVTKLEKAAK